MSQRTFPGPWQVEPNAAGNFVIKDASGFALAYVYARRSLPGRNGAKRRIPTHKFGHNSVEYESPSTREVSMVARIIQLVVLLAAGWGMTVFVAAADLRGSGQSVVDGDEFMLCEGEACTDIRLCGIDTPSRGTTGYGETVGALTKLVIGQKILCRQVGEGSVCDGRADPISRGRTVAQCFTESETVDVAGALVAAGHGCDRIDRSGGYYSKDHPEWQCKQ